MSNWPQAAGPNGNWQVKGKAPTHWSVAQNQNVAWRLPLPEVGQSGIAVWDDGVFLTTMAVQTPDNRNKESGDIVGHAVSARTGKLLWSVPLPAREPSPYAYGFSDSSSPTPVTDGKRVWFTNASGHIACCDLAGNVLWRREWKPTTGRPFNKQFEPLLDQGILVSCEPRDEGDPKRERDPWNYLKGLEASTGKVLWVSEDALTHYNTPGFGKRGGVFCVLQGRGGHHGVPETPSGLSLTRLRDGKALWRTALPGKALYNMHWDETNAVWLDEDHGTLTVVETRTGKVLRTTTLARAATWRHWEKGRYITESDVDLTARQIRVFPGWFTNVTVERACWFLCFSNPKPSYGMGPVGPLYCVGRVTLETGQVEYLELPTAPGVYGQPVAASTVNARGVDVAQDPRSKRDGWHWCFIGSPSVIDGKIYWTLQNGITYVVDSRVEALHERALVAVNDLGPLGQTWSMNAISYANGRLYHRSLKELVCIAS